MKRFGMILSYCRRSGRGVIQDAKGKKFSFSKKFNQTVKVARNTPVEFQIQIHNTDSIKVSKLSLPKTPTKRDIFLRMFELEKNQLELPFVG